MKRRIVQHGSSSLTVTLPIKWVEKYKLKKGDELDIEQLGPTLQVSTQKEIASTKKEVSATEFGVFTKNNLSHLYQLGYDEIEISFDDQKTLNEIKKRVPDCIGFEIIDQKKNKVYIKSIATTLDTEFDTMLRKSFLIINEMAKELVVELEKGKYDRLSEIREMESLNNKFTDFCIRILNKKGYKVPQRSMQMYEVVKNSERIADEFKYICDAISGYDKKLDKDTVSAFKETVNYYLAFYEIFYKFTPELKKRIYEDKNRLLKKFEGMLEKSKSKDTIVIHHLISLVQKTYDGASGYYALIL